MHSAIITPSLFYLSLVVSTTATISSDKVERIRGFSAVQGKYKNAKISNLDVGTAHIQERAKTAKVSAQGEVAEQPLGTLNPLKGMKRLAEPCDDQEGGQKATYKASAAIFKDVSVELGSAQQVQDEFFAMLNYTFREGAQRARLVQLESVLHPMFAALPKNADGHLEHGVARYALHRLFLQEHRWFIKGLNTTEDQSNSSKQKEWIPQHIFDLIEKHHGVRGISVHELTALALTLEDLIHKETNQRVDAIRKIFAVNEEMTALDALELVETYMLVFLVNGNVSFHNSKDALRKLARVKRKIASWKSVEDELMLPVFKDMLSASRTGVTLLRDPMKETVNIKTVNRVTEMLGEKFGAFNDKDCTGVRDVLRDIKGPNPGRVPLSEFYQKALYSQWIFSESIGYLRVLGALDESNATMPEVIVPNYLESASNCRMSTSLYKICCLSPCNSIIGRLEQDIASPMGELDEIIAVVDTFSPSLISDAKPVDTAMRQKLEDLAMHNGKVLLHSHNFANWLHQMFPFDCPFSHGTGAVGAQAADEWLEEMGHDNARATKDEMVCYVNGGGKLDCSKQSNGASAS